MTSKNGKRKEHDQSSEIRGVLSYVHLKDGQVAKPETQKLVTYEQFFLKCREIFSKIIQDLCIVC